MAWEEKQLEADNHHFMFISILSLAIIALLIGDANNRALSERCSKKPLSMHQDKAP